jgi:hypothetical protein
MMSTLKSNIWWEQFVKFAHLFRWRIFIKRLKTDLRQILRRSLKSRILRSNSTLCIIWICRSSNSFDFISSTCSRLSRSIYACIVKSSRSININSWTDTINDVQSKMYHLSFSTFASEIFFHAELLSSSILTSRELSSNSFSYAKIDACWCLAILTKKINIKINTQCL